MKGWVAVYIWTSSFNGKIFLAFKTKQKTELHLLLILFMSWFLRGVCFAHLSSLCSVRWLYLLSVQEISCLFVDVVGLQTQKHIHQNCFPWMLKCLLFIPKVLQLTDIIIWTWFVHSHPENPRFHFVSRRSHLFPVLPHHSSVILVFVWRNYFWFVTI